MAQKSIELILFRQFAYYMSFPIFIIDEEGNLIFCNEPVEKILGFKLSETGEMTANEWESIFVPQDQDGVPIKNELLPLFISQTERRSAHDRFYIKSVQNELRHIEFFAFPIVNQTNIFLGSIVLFQELYV